MIDIHTHILPGVDDGAEDLEDSYLMAELAEESDVETIICTPHSNMRGIFENYYTDEYTEKIQKLNRLVQDRGLSITLLPGMEIYATEDVAERIRSGQVISLNYTKNYLIEFGFHKSSIWMTKILEKILRLGVTPVVAHPERYECVQQDPEVVQLWNNMGCQMQINKGSVFGKFGRGAWKVAGELLYSGQISYVASDAHSPYQRTTYLKDTWHFLCEEFSRELAQQVLYENPYRLIHGERSPYIRKENAASSAEQARVQHPFK